MYRLTAEQLEQITLPKRYAGISISSPRRIEAFNKISCVGVTFIADQVDRMHNFYRDVLGGRSLAHSPKDFALIQFGSNAIGFSSRKGDEPDSFGHLYLVVEHRDELLERLLRLAL